MSPDLAVGAEVPTASNHPRAQSSALILAFVVVFAALLFHVWPWLANGLGYSHDGFNAGMWGLGARGAAEEPLGNRLGGIHPDGSRYAMHPPLLVWSLTPITAILDDWPLGLRVVPLAASILSIVLLAVLLLDSGVSKWAAAAGVILAGTSGMYLTYGALVDTPVFGLPFALSSIWTAQRAWQGRPPSTWLASVVGFLAALAGWQAVFTAVIAGGFALAASLRARDRRRSAALGLLGGTGAGLVVDLGWVWWVMGGLSDLIDQGVSRTEVPVSMWIAKQVEFGVDLFGWPLLATTGLGTVTTAATACVRWLKRRWSPVGDGEPAFLDTGRRRSPALLLSAITFAVVFYAAVFKHGAFVHDYWNFYGVALVGAGSAVVVDVAFESTRMLSRVTRQAVVGGLAAMVVLLALVGIRSRSLADFRIQRGLDAVTPVEAIPKAVDPHDVVVTTLGGDAGKPWLNWTTHGRNKHVTESEVADLPADERVLISLPFPRDPSDWVGTSAVARGQFALIPAGELVELKGR